MKQWFLWIIAMAFLVACGDGWSVSAEGDRLNAHYRYYYASDCAYDYEPYDCSEIHSVSPSMSVGLRIESDGFATLTLNGIHYNYFVSEYTEGYDRGQYYYQFYSSDGEVTVYEDGSEMIYLDSYEGVAYYYYRDLW